MKKIAEYGQLTATKLRAILSILIVAIVLLIIAAIFFGNKLLSSSSEPLHDSIIKSHSSQNLLDDINLADKKLHDQKKSVEQARQIIAQSQDYKYQEQLIYDLNQYAKMTGVAISSYKFDVAAPGQTRPSANASTGPTAVKKTIAPAGTTTASATITLNEDLNYENFLKFIYLIEKNIVQIRIQSLDISAQVDQSGQLKVAAPSINMEIFIKK